MKKLLQASLLLLHAVFGLPALHAQTYSTNLLLNPGAEAGSLTNWTVGGTSSPFVDSGTFNPSILPHPPGSYDFVGGTGASGSLTQIVSITNVGGFSLGAVDAGSVRAEVSFWERTLSGQSDSAFVSLNFFNASNQSLGAAATIRIASASWLQHTRVFAVPPDTRSIAYVMQFVRFSGTPLDAYLDDNSLRLTDAAADNLTPGNDTCANAIVMNSGQTYSVSNFFYATELGDVRTNGWDSGIYRGVWFKITNTNSQRLNITTCASDFDTGLAIYTNDCGTLREITGNNNNGPYCSFGNYQASVSFSSPANSTYYIQAGANSATATGILRILADLQDPPGNDTCANAIVMQSGVTYSVSNMFYATEIMDPNTNCAANISRGVWYQLTPPSGARVTVGTCGSEFGTVMAIYTGNCESPVEFKCANQSGPVACSGKASVNFTDVGGLTYYILVGGNIAPGQKLNILADVVPPNNDQCPNAIPMTVGVPYSVNTLNATELNDPQPACSPGLSHGVWYTFTSTVARAYALTTCGSSFPTALAVYQGGCGSSNLVACTNSSGPYCSGYASLNFIGVAGTQYHILAGSATATAGDLRILLADYDLVSSGLVATNKFTTSVPATTLVAGRPAWLSWRVTNAGASALAATWTDRLSISNASTNYVFPISPAFRNLTGYGQGGNFTMPPISNGTYTLFATADFTGQIAESSEANNTVLGTVVVTNLSPAVTLTTPSNTIQWVICGPAHLKLSAQTVAGSYNIRRVEYWDGAIKIGESSNAPAFQTTSQGLTQGVHVIRATVEDVNGYTNLSPNQVQVTLTWPKLHELHGELNTNGAFVCCSGVLLGSNYVVQSTTNLLSTNTLWQTYLVTNGVTWTNLVFTNQPLNSHRYFRLFKP